MRAPKDKAANEGRDPDRDGYFVAAEVVKQQAQDMAAQVAD